MSTCFHWDMTDSDILQTMMHDNKLFDLVPEFFNVYVVLVFEVISRLIHRVLLNSHSVRCAD